MNKSFTFSKLPKDRAELEAMPEAALSDAFATAALCVAAYCNYGTDASATHDMIDFLRGPREMSTFEKQFLRDRLGGKAYKPFSFFSGAVPSNNYTPDVPYVITVSDNPYSYVNDGYATLYIRSGGADSPRPITLRRKGEQWFLWEQQLFADIRLPAAEDPWA